MKGLLPGITKITIEKISSLLKGDYSALVVEDAESNDEEDEDEE